MSSGEEAPYLASGQSFPEKGEVKWSEGLISGLAFLVMW